MDGVGRGQGGGDGDGGEGWRERLGRDRGEDLDGQGWGGREHGR